MNWIKANKFLSGFLGVMLVGVAVLGYLLWTAKGKHADIFAQYEEQATELSRLQGLVPFPSDPNLKLLEAQRKEHQAAVVAVQAELAKNELPLETLTDVQFQDKLKESVARVKAKASERGMTLPDKFFMGFDRYEAQPPRAEAASALGRQLKAIEFVVMQVIENGATLLEKLDPQPLPEEAIEKKGGDKPETKGPEKGDKGEKSLVSRLPFEIKFTAEQLSFQSILNKIVASKTQFFIPRVVEVKNTADKGPKRSEAAATPPPPPPPGPGTPAPVVPGQPGSPAPKPPTPPAGTPAVPTEGYKLIVGEEKLEVTMRLEVVDFTEPTVTASK